MSNQMGQEIERLGRRFLAAAETVAEKVESKIGEAAVAVGDAATRLDKTILNELLPKLSDKIDSIAAAAEAHAAVTARRLGAEVKKATTQPEVLSAEARREFAMLVREIAHRSTRDGNLPAFLKSDLASIEAYDTNSTGPHGIALFPRPEHLQFLTKDFLPLRLHLSSEGLRIREYSEIPIGESARGPSYKLNLERPATSKDLIELNLSSKDLLAILDGYHEDRRFKTFAAL